MSHLAKSMEKSKIMFKTNCKVFLHHITPKFLLTKSVGLLASKELGWFTQLLIKKFAKTYHVDMSEAKEPNFEAYKTFNAFFTRELKDDARPICEGDNTVAMPVDGTMAEFGTAKYGRLIAAKGQDYSLRNLLGGSDQLANEFQDGNFACIYLSPSNYHRIHMPVTGKLRQMIFIPGEFYSVNPTYVAHIDNLFTKNERCVCIFDTEFGAMAMVLVGATIVGSIATKWAGRVYPENRNSITIFDYQSEDIVLEKGTEMGQFYLGSTVITVVPPKAWDFIDTLKTGDAVRFGQQLATTHTPKV